VKLQEILARQAAIRSELARLDQDPETTEEDFGDLRDSLVDEFKTLDSRAKPIIERMQEINAIRAAHVDPANTEAGSVGGGDPNVIVRNKRDPFANIEEIEKGFVARSEMVGRAQDAIERYEKRGVLSREYAENAASRCQHNHMVARHYLLTGSDDYRESFDEYLRTGDNNVASRTGLRLSTGSAGFMLPFVLDPSIILTNSSSANPWRRISRVVQTTSNTWNGVNSAGVTAAWLGEGTAAADATPTIGQIQVTPQKASAWVLGSYEALDDTDFGQQLPGLLSDARDRLEEATFTTGAGTGTIPQGLLTALGTGTGTNVSYATTGAGNTPVAADIYALNAAVPPRFRLTNNAAWIGNIFYLNKVRALDVYGGGSFWANIGAALPEQLLGKPVYESSTMTSSTATGSQTIVFGDFNQAVIVDRVGVSMLYEPLVKGGSAPFPPTGEAGWFMFWRTGFGVSTTSAFRVLKNS
jgi:HK97 family phage major capsid protein